MDDVEFVGDGGWVEGKLGVLVPVDASIGYTSSGSETLMTDGTGDTEPCLASELILTLPSSFIISSWIPALITSRSSLSSEDSPVSTGSTFYFLLSLDR